VRQRQENRRGYPRLVSSVANPHPDGGLDVVVDPDGALRVPADELARHGVRPGSHLRIVSDVSQAGPRRSVRGALAGTLTTDELNGLLRALDDVRAERVVSTEQRWT